jgi:hypothetical protein
MLGFKLDIWEFLYDLKIARNPAGTTHTDTTFLIELSVLPVFREARCS